MIFFNKKGDIRNQLEGLIIGVLCLALIVFAAVKIYGVFANQEAENAKKTLNSIEGKINLLQDGQSNTFPIPGFKGSSSIAAYSETNGWILESWSKGDGLRPDKCTFNSCLCICPLTTAVYTNALTRSENCQANGICRYFDYNTIETSMDDKSYNLYLKEYSGNKEEFAFIVLQNNAIEIEIAKLNNSIIITRIG